MGALTKRSTSSPAQWDDGTHPSMLGDDVLGGARRVLIYGVTGSGKTTLAKELSELTSLPWYSVDDMTWEPGWVE